MQPQVRPINRDGWVLLDRTLHLMINNTPCDARGAACSNSRPQLGAKTFGGPEGRNWSGVDPPLSLQPRLPHGLHCSLSSLRVRPATGLACVPNSSRSLPPWLGSELWVSGSRLYRLGALLT